MATVKQNGVQIEDITGQTDADHAKSPTNGALNGAPKEDAKDKIQLMSVEEFNADWKPKADELRKAAEEYDKQNEKFLAAERKYYQALDNFLLKKKKNLDSQALADEVEESKNTKNELLQITHEALVKLNTLNTKYLGDRIGNLTMSNGILIDRVKKFDPNAFSKA